MHLPARMGQRKQRNQALPTIWHVPDDLWDIIEPILTELDPPAPRGRPRIDPRAALDGIIYRARTGCQWNQLPRAFGDDSSIHRTFQRWVTNGVLDALWRVLVEACEDLGAVHWEWQAADAAMGKARHGGDAVGKNPTDRGKKWHQAQRARRGARRTARGGDRRRQCP